MKEWFVGAIGCMLAISAAPAQSFGETARPIVAVNEIYLSGAMSIAVSPDGAILAVGHRDGTVRFWDWHSGKLIKVIPVHQKRIEQLEFFAEGEWIAALRGPDGLFGPSELFLISIADGQKITMPVAYNHPFFIPEDESFVAVTSHDHGLELHDLIADAVRRIPTEISLSHTYLAKDGSFIVAEDGSTLPQEVVLLDTQSGNELARFSPGFDPQEFAISPDASTLAIMDAEADNFELWDMKRLSSLAELKGHEDALFGGIFSPDGSLFVDWARDGTLVVWEVPTGVMKSRLIGHLSTVWGAAFLDGGRYLASASDDGSARIWSVASGKEIVALYGVGEGAEAAGYAAVMPDGHFVGSPEARHLMIRSQDGDSVSPLTDTAIGELWLGEEIDVLRGVDAK